MRRWQVTVKYLDGNDRYHCDISPMIHAGAVPYKETKTFAEMIPILHRFGYDDDSVAIVRHEIDRRGTSTQLNVDISEDAAKAFGWVDPN
jgi:hypothetical protein